MKCGDLLRGTIREIDNKGRGITGRVVVPFTAIGDEIEAKLVRRNHGQWIGKLVGVLAPSKDRVEPPCPHAGVCGGCLWQHLAYDAQLALKKEMINRALTEADHEEQVQAVVPAKKTLFYRNRMDYTVGWKQELGLKEYGSWNRSLDLNECLLLSKDVPSILAAVRELMRRLSLEPWDAKRSSGLLRYILIREGKKTGERLIVVVVKDAQDPRLKGDNPTKPYREITEALAPFCTSLFIGENPEITDLSFSRSFIKLHGKNFLTEEISGIRYMIHPNSFFQTNSGMAEDLQKTVLEFLGEKNAPRKGKYGGSPLHERSVLDLYCGLGFFGIAAAKHGAHVTGIEIDKEAIALAKMNAEQNGVADRTTWIASAAEQAIDTIRALPVPDIAILDPPRSGLHPKVLEVVLEQKPKILIYVSCNYQRFVKELVRFKDLYRIERMEALDLFPHTPHVELVTKLVLSSSHACAS